MPTFFNFQQGSEDNSYPGQDSSPLLGRYRAVPRPRPITPSSSRAWGGIGVGARSHLQGLLAAAHNRRGSVHIGYGTTLSGWPGLGLGLDDEGSEDDDTDSENDAYYTEEGGLTLLGWRLKKLLRSFEDTWVTPRAGAVKKVVGRWWSCWIALVFLPAALAIAWCAVPFPRYAIRDGPGHDGQGDSPDDGFNNKAPGHGNARVRVSFWFFLLFYYACYNLTALIWITKVFNIYSLNWWPQSMGFLATVTAIAVVSLVAPIPIYLMPETRFLTAHNTAWIAWTFVVMAMPVAIAFFILMTNERHQGLRQSLSETQRIFTSSWWTGEPDTPSRRRAPLDADFSALRAGGLDERRLAQPSMRRRWLPASFVRFVWFCLALSVGLLAYVMGEAYAEIYLRTLPHNNLETIVYVYGWITTVYLLDGLTGWILGGNEGERVGSYPLAWTFKLYFMLTYHTYVRALYARLRSPSQFITLQLLSSSGLILVTPLLMSAPAHWLLTAIGCNGQSYGAYQKMCVRNVFIRFLAENVSMLAFLGSVVVLHFGANKDVYPYFAFDDGDGGDAYHYSFGLTFYASSVTWACELVASMVVAGLIRCIFGISVVAEGLLDLIVWPELLPASVAVMLHVLQNMFFSIIRLQF